MLFLEAACHPLQGRHTRCGASRGNTGGKATLEGMVASRRLGRWAVAWGCSKIIVVPLFCVVLGEFKGTKKASVTGMAMWEHLRIARDWKQYDKV